MNDAEKKVIFQMLDDIIRRCAPKSSTVLKYGGTLYTLKPDEKEGQFCGIFSYKNHVQLAISYEPPLKDPMGILLGAGKTRRHVNFASPDEVVPRKLESLLRQAAKHHS